MSERFSIAHKPLWTIGFRPFFLAGAAFACVAVAIWSAWLYARLSGVGLPGDMFAWHRHEMAFGFVTAIVAGFLLTAVPNWTGRPGLSGWPLMGLLLVWLVARLAWWVPIPMSVLLVLQLPFLPLLAWVLGRDLVAAGKRENYPIVLVVGLLAGCQWLALWGMAHADMDGQGRGVLAALWLVAALMSVIGGRVIPFFIQRGLNRPVAPPVSAWPTQVLLLGTVLAAALIAAGVNDGPRPWLAVLYGLLGALHLLRWWRWHDRGLWRVPLLWSLYLAYGWLVMATLGMALWQLGVMPQQSLATHALTVGGVGGLVLAMIARVSLGHTGRALQPSTWIVTGFVLMMLAAVCRVFVVPFSSYGLALSAFCWCAAFALFLVAYTRILAGPRV